MASSTLLFICTFSFCEWKHRKFEGKKVQILQKSCCFFIWLENLVCQNNNNNNKKATKCNRNTLSELIMTNMTKHGETWLHALEVTQVSCCLLILATCGAIKSVELHKAARKWQGPVSRLINYVASDQCINLRTRRDPIQHFRLFLSHFFIYWFQNSPKIDT